MYQNKYLTCRDRHRRVLDYSQSNLNVWQFKSERMPFCNYATDRNVSVTRFFITTVPMYIRLFAFWIDSFQIPVSGMCVSSIICCKRPLRIDLFVTSLERLSAA
jgi:hypothetical protein